jgi:hypothetical protein
MVHCSRELLITANFHLKSSLPFSITNYWVFLLIIPADARWVGIAPAP